MHIKSEPRPKKASNQMTLGLYLLNTDTRKLSDWWYNLINPFLMKCARHYNGNHVIIGLVSCYLHKSLICQGCINSGF